MEDHQWLKYEPHFRKLLLKQKYFLPLLAISATSKFVGVGNQLPFLKTDEGVVKTNDPT